MLLASLATISFVLLVRTADGSWEAGVGDPTLRGWLTFLAYFWAAYCAFQAYRVAEARARLQSQTDHASGASRLTWAWAGLCLIMVALGFNKQLDLQDLILIVGEQLARTADWIGRQGLRWILRGVALSALAAGSGVLWSLRRELRELWLAPLGCALLFGFVVLRSMMVPRINAFLDGLGLNLYRSYVLELAGIACIGASALRYVRLHPARRR